MFVAVAVLVVYLLPVSCPSIFRKRSRWAQMSEMLLFENYMFQFGKDLFLSGNGRFLFEKVVCLKIINTFENTINVSCFF